MTLDEYIKVNACFYPRFDRDAMNGYLSIFELTPDLNLGKLSMGQKKKAFISFAMACNTSLLILDEPTNGLDISAKRSFRRAIAQCMTDEKASSSRPIRCMTLTRFLTTSSSPTATAY